MTRIICDDLDLALWKRARRFFITASDVGTYIGDERIPSYYRETPGSIISEKIEGYDREFPPRSIAPITHGQYSEDHNRDKASKLFGLPICAYHQFVTHEKWPWVGATLDGLGLVSHLVAPDYRFAREYGRDDHFKPFETMTQVQDARGDLELLKKAGCHTIIVEMKASDAHTFKTEGVREWIDRMPPAIECQVQTQLHVMEMEHALVAGQLGSGQMTGYVVDRDQRWAGILDEANARAEEDLHDLAGDKEEFLGSLPVWGHHV